MTRHPASRTNSTPRRAITRRRFLTIGGATGIWMVNGCSSPEQLADPTTTLRSDAPTATTATTARPSDVGTAPLGDADDHVLVLVQLLGGNDALNTVVPSDGRYRDARPTLALDEASLLTWGDGLSVHPALAPLTDLYAGGDLALAAGVGFAGQTRSHFDSRDLWWRASADPSSDGWLARWIDRAAIDRPDEAMEAIALGAGPRALAGSSAAAINDPTDIELDAPAGMDQGAFEEFLLATAAPSPSDPELLSAARGALPAALSAQKIVSEAIESTADDPYGDEPVAALGLQLTAASSLIRTRPGLRVVTVGIEGFDTHASQLATHDQLLGQVASSLRNFWDGLGDEHQARTLVMTTSEFGRRVAENGSAGTDHGRAGVQMVLGGGVAGGQMIGQHRLDALEDGDLPIDVLADDLYGDALRWLGGPVDEVLGADRPATGLLTL